MKIQNPEAKEKLIQRLRRIEGQVRGVEAMLDEERDCQEILQQLSAVRSAVQSTSRIFLQGYATACLLELDQETPPESRYDIRGKREKIVLDMIALLDKAP
jgi:CsoR family transcriptional regulator, copper-sensing transcriptional repressor